MPTRDQDRDATRPRPEKPLTRAEVEEHLVDGAKSATEMDRKLRSVFDVPESEDTLRLR